jgi:hypothetical protein
MVGGFLNSGRMPKGINLFPPAIIYLLHTHEHIGGVRFSVHHSNFFLNIKKNYI